MKKTVLSLVVLVSAVALAQKIIPPPRPMPQPLVHVADLRADEKPVIVATEAKIAADNGLFRRVETTITFTNPNARVFAGELEFPIPDGATVCGYELEVNGTMVPGVVVPKEQARVAFENETKKGIDPGIVEHVKGNVWKTRIFPLTPNTPRKAMVAYIVENGTDGTHDMKMRIRNAAVLLIGRVNGGVHYYATAHKVLQQKLPCQSDVLLHGKLILQGNVKAVGKLRFLPTLGFLYGVP